MSLNTTPITWVAGTALTAAQMNAEVRDAITGIQAAWTNDARATTVIWTGATTNPAIGNGAIISRYLQIGKTIIWEVRITAGTTTTFGTGGWKLTPPFAPLVFYMGNGQARGYDSSLSTATGWAFSLDCISPAFNVMCPPATQPNADRAVTVTIPFAWATGDVLFAQMIYESV